MQSMLNLLLRCGHVCAVRSRLLALCPPVCCVVKVWFCQCFHSVFEARGGSLCWGDLCDSDFVSLLWAFARVGGYRWRTLRVASGGFLDLELLAEGGQSYLHLLNDYAEC